MAKRLGTEEPPVERVPRRKTSTRKPVPPVSESAKKFVRIGTTFGMLCAAALSAPSIFLLGILVGYPVWIAWLLAASLDGYAFVSIWFGNRVPFEHPARRSAIRNARLALTLTVACNAGYHLLALAGSMIDPWARVLLLVSVGALPPFIVARLVHLASLANGAGEPVAAQRADAIPVASAPAERTKPVPAIVPAPAPVARTADGATQLVPKDQRAHIIRELIVAHGRDNVTGPMVAEALGVDRSNGFRALRKVLGDLDSADPEPERVLTAGGWS